MQLFVRHERTHVVQIDAGRDVKHLKTVLQGMLGMPAEVQRLICCGKQLSNEQRLGSTCRDGNTIHLTASLRGGKGGFGNLLRNAGRTATTTNFDACRTLDGRRIREVDAEKKQAEWAAEAQARALEKIAMQHLREQAREARRAELEKVDARGALEAQQATLESTKTAVADALKGAAHAGKGTKRGAGEQLNGRAAKRGMLAQVLDDDDDDESSEEEEDVGPVGNDDIQVDDQAPSSGTVGAAVEQQQLKQPKQQDQINKQSTTQQHDAAATPPVSPVSQPPPPQEQPPSYPPINLTAYDSAAALAAAYEPQHLKAELMRVGLKCGGTSMQRAQRLFLLRSTPLDAIDAKHKAPVNNKASQNGGGGSQ